MSQVRELEWAPNEDSPHQWSLVETEAALINMKRQIHWEPDIMKCLSVFRLIVLATWFTLSH